MLLLVNTSSAEAASEVFFAVGQYTASEGESMVEAKERALANALENISEQAGVFIRSFSQTHDLQLVDDQVTVVKAKVLDVLEKEFYKPEVALKDGKYITSFTVRVKATVDTDEIIRLAERKQELNDLKESMNKLQDNYAKSVNEYNELSTDLDSLKMNAYAIHNMEAKNVRGVTNRVIEEATALINQKDYYRAKALLERAAANEQNNAFLHYKLAYICLLTGEINQGIESINRAIELNADDYLFFLLRGALYKKLGKGEETLVNYNAALQMAPRQYECYAWRGRYLFDDGKYGEALNDFCEVMILKPDYLSAYFLAAGCCEALTYYEFQLRICNEGIQQCEKAGKNFIALYTKQRLMLYKGEYAKGYQMADSVINSATSNLQRGTAHQGKYVACCGINRPEEALAEMKAYRINSGEMFDEKTETEKIKNIIEELQVIRNNKQETWNRAKLSEKALLFTE